MRSHDSGRSNGKNGGSDVSVSDVSSEIEVEDAGLLLKAFGPGCSYLESFERETGVNAGIRGNRILLKGPAADVARAERVIGELVELVKDGRSIKEIDVVRGARIIDEHPHMNLTSVLNDVVLVTSRKRMITPKSLNQKIYVEKIRLNDLVFSIGPAGTGKTYLAMASAVSALNEKKFKRIILTRPAVEAGEKLGFLPGDMVEKVNPYLRPLYDALHDMMDMERAQNLISQGIIEVAPLAFMRGRTLNDSFVILDEAQNASVEQMKMFLTRLGYSSKAVVTGDITQIDLPGSMTSGLVHAEKVLKDIKGIEFLFFDDEDVVRHPLVQQIIKAYEREEHTGKNNG